MVCDKSTKEFNEAMTKGSIGIVLNHVHKKQPSDFHISIIS